MKKKIIFVIIIALILILGFTVSLAIRNIYEGEETAREIGLTISSSVLELFEQDDQATPDGMIQRGEAFAVVMDEVISQAYFNMRVSLYKSVGSNTPEIDAWQSIKEEVAERKFAEEHNIMPTEKEILEFTQEMRNEIESTEESYAIGKALVEAMGLTWEQYWEVYKPKYESPAHLIKIKIANYRKESNLNAIDVSNIEYHILSQDYVDLLDY